MELQVRQTENNIRDGEARRRVKWDRATAGCCCVDFPASDSHCYNFASVCCCCCLRIRRCYKNTSSQPHSHLHTYRHLHPHAHMYIHLYTQRVGASGQCDFLLYPNEHYLNCLFLALFNILSLLVLLFLLLLLLLCCCLRPFSIFVRR